MVTRNPDMGVRSVELTAIGELQGAEHPSKWPIHFRPRGLLRSQIALYEARIFIWNQANLRDASK